MTVIHSLLCMHVQGFQPEEACMCMMQVFLLYTFMVKVSTITVVGHPSIAVPSPLKNYYNCMSIINSVEFASISILCDSVEFIVF